MSVLFSLRKTSVDVLNVVTNSADMFSHAIGSAAAMAESLELHAQAYRDNTRIEIDATREKLKVTAVVKAQHKVARVMLDLQSECKDPAFADMLTQVQAQWGQPTVALSLVAAE